MRWKRYGASIKLRRFIINEVSDIMGHVADEYEYEGGDLDKLMEEYERLDEIRTRNHWAIYYDQGR